MSTWDEIKKMRPLKKLRKDPRWRAERMGFVKPQPRHLAVPPTAQELRQMRDSTKRKRAAAQSKADKEQR